MLIENIQLLQQIVAEIIAKRVKNEEVSASEIEKIIECISVPESMNNQYNMYEWVICVLTFLPHVKSSFFDEVISEIFPNGGDFISLGGARGNSFRGFIPTVETIQYVLAGDNLTMRQLVLEHVDIHSKLQQNGIITLEEIKEFEPQNCAKIILNKEYIELFSSGKQSEPIFSLEFPARLLKTKMQWADLILHPATLDQINDIKNWYAHSQKILSDSNLGRKVKPGYKTLFFGPSGTGKTLTATLLGKYFDKPVYRIDLSQIVSKYIGETEKNLEKIFARAENKDWILFFDEADALFGKRSGVQSSHDKYANQEVSYLLQRVEEFNGLIILASNFKSNIDAAFVRRFNAIIHFPMPSAEERLQLWNNAKPENLHWHSDVELQKIAQKYEFSGASIINIVHYAALKTHSKNEETISNQYVMDGIKKEMLKEDKLVGL